MGAFGLSNKVYLPFVKVNCKDGIVERSTFDGNERGTEIVENFVALFDFATLQVGYMRFDGEAPDMQLVALGDPLPDSPGKDYKQGVKVVVQLPGELGLHEISTTSQAAKTALESLYEEVVAAPEWEQGQVPAVRLTHWTPEKTKRGTRKTPNLKIVGWKERPKEFLKYKAVPKPRAAISAGKVAAANPVTTGSEPIAPLASAQMRAEATSKTASDDFDPDDFG